MIDCVRIQFGFQSVTIEKEKTSSYILGSSSSYNDPELERKIIQEAIEFLQKKLIC